MLFKFKKVLLLKILLPDVVMVNFSEELVIDVSNDSGSKVTKVLDPVVVEFEASLVVKLALKLIVEV